jgi:hypothetical protein
VNTLWKDVGYTASYYALFGCLIRIIFSKGAWLTFSSNKLIFTCLCITLTTFRGNGFPVIFVVLCSLSIFRHLRWRHLTLQTILLCSALLACHSISTTVLAPPKYKFWTAARSIPVHLLSAGYQMNLLDSQEIMIMDKIKPHNIQYNCRNSVGLFFFNPFVDVFRIHYYSKDIFKSWFSFVLSHPQVYLNHIACGSKFIYYPWATSPIYKYATKINGNTINTRYSSLDTGLFDYYARTLIIALTSISECKLFKSVFWWPGFSLWLIIFLMIVYAVRSQNYDWLILVIMILSQSIVLLFLVPNDQFRYQWPIIICMPIVFLIHFAKKSPTISLPLRQHSNRPTIIIIVALIMSSFSCAFLDNRPWHRTIYEGGIPKGDFLTELRPSIDHNIGPVFQDGRPHYLVYKTCLNSSELTNYSISLNQKRNVKIYANGKSLDFKETKNIRLDEGSHLLQVEFGINETRPNFVIRNLTTHRAPILQLPINGGCL